MEKSVGLDDIWLPCQQRNPDGVRYIAAVRSTIRGRRRRPFGRRRIELDVAAGFAAERTDWQRRSVLQLQVAEVVLVRYALDPARHHLAALKAVEDDAEGHRSAAFGAGLRSVVHWHFSSVTCGTYPKLSSPHRMSACRREEACFHSPRA